MNIKELREALDAEEAKWTAQDKHFLGDFEQQEIYSLSDKGVVKVTPVLDACFGIIFLTKKPGE